MSYLENKDIISEMFKNQKNAEFKNKCIYYVSEYIGAEFNSGLSEEEKESGIFPLGCTFTDNDEEISAIADINNLSIEVFLEGNLIYESKFETREGFLLQLEMLDFDSIFGEYI